MKRSIPIHTTKPQMDTSLAIVNIVLLLIFFFLATGSLLTGRGFGVNVAETVDLPIESLPQPILVVEAAGALSLNGEPIAPDTLVAALASETQLHVLIDRGAPALDLVQLLTEPGLKDLDILLVTVHRRGEDS